MSFFSLIHSLTHSLTRPPSVCSHRELFLNNGYDLVGFLPYIKSEDLLQMGICEETEVKGLLAAFSVIRPNQFVVPKVRICFFKHQIHSRSGSSKTPCIPSPPHQPDQNASQWLESLDLPQYIPQFEKAGVDSIQKITAVNPVDLMLRYGVKTPGHRQRILSAVSYLKTNPSPSASSLSSGASSVASSQAPTPISSDTARPASIAMSHPSTDSLKSLGDTAASKPLAVSPGLAHKQLPAATPLVVSVASLKSPHSDDEVRTGVSFVARYVGSRSITHNVDASTTAASLRKMRDTGKVVKDKAPISLQISATDIKYIDPASHMCIINHPLDTISNHSSELCCVAVGLV